MSHSNFFFCASHSLSLSLVFAVAGCSLPGEVGAQSDSAPLYPVAMDLLLSLAMMGRGR